MSTHTTLKGGIEHVGQSQLSDQLERNVLSFLQWGFLGIGAFYNVEAGTSGAYGGRSSRLRLVSDPNFTSGQVWEANRQHWVWETGVAYNRQPINVSGVYVNGNFHPAGGTGTFAHHVNYALGQVVFDSPISTSSVVTCEYSHRYVNFSTADVPWWREFQLNSMRVDDNHFLQQGSGAWNVLGQNRIQLPAVIVEALPRTDRYPAAIGSASAIVRQDVLCHVIAETRWEFKTIHDVLTSQWQKRLVGFDVNAVLEAQKFPLDANGSRVTGALMYPELINAYPWRQIRIVESQSFDYSHAGPLYRSTVRNVCEVEMP